MYTIYNDDCFNILKQLDDNSIDCIVTSPPYNKGYFNYNKKNNQVWQRFEIQYNSYTDDLPLEEYEQWMIDFINLCLEKIKSNGSFFFNHKPIRLHNNVYFPLKFIQQTKANIYQEIIWNRTCSPNIRNDCLLPCTERVYWLTKGKPNVYRNMLEDEFVSEVWEIKPPLKNKYHPAPFPELLVKNCINLTTKENDLVLDPFMGSGTTGIVCMKLDRNFIGIELDKKYFDIAETQLKENIKLNEI